MNAGNETAQADIRVEWGYFFAVVEFNAHEIANEDVLDEVVCHELLHVVLAPLSSFAENGAGKVFNEHAINLTERTIEQLMPGYLALYRTAFKKKRTKRS